MTGHLIVNDEDATRVITLRRPEKKNAFTQDMYRGLSDAIDTAQNNPDIRCIIITGGGSGVFTSGNDLEDFLRDSTSTAETPRAASNAVKLLYSLAHNVKPIIAAVDGVAIGIGTTMLFHCDYVLASKTAVFSTPFINLGLVPEGASSLLMPRTMGYQRAFAMPPRPEYESGILPLHRRGSTCRGAGALARAPCPANATHCSRGRAQRSVPGPRSSSRAP